MSYTLPKGYDFSSLVYLFCFVVCLRACLLLVFSHMEKKQIHGETASNTHTLRSLQLQSSQKWLSEPTNQFIACLALCSGEDIEGFGNFVILASSPFVFHCL